MRPTIEEQLTGTCRILESIVAPEVGAPYAADILRGLISNLRMMAEALPRLSAFLAWDNAESAALLAEMVPSVDAPLAARITAALEADAPDPLDQPALDRRNEELRALLSEAIRGGTLPQSLLIRLEAHFVERATRNPIRFAITLPRTNVEK